MDAFEHLIHDLGVAMNLSLSVDSHQSCRLHFPNHDLFVQLDLEADGETLLLGTELGVLEPGSFLNSFLKQALIMNGISKGEHGSLAYSEKKHTLILFAFLPLRTLSGTSLNTFLDRFLTQALTWKEALKNGVAPTLEHETVSSGNRMFGL